MWYHHHLIWTAILLKCCYLRISFFNAEQELVKFGMPSYLLVGLCVISVGMHLKLLFCLVFHWCKCSDQLAFCSYYILIRKGAVDWALHFRYQAVLFWFIFGVIIVIFFLNFHWSKSTYQLVMRQVSSIQGGGLVVCLIDIR